MESLVVLVVTLLALATVTAPLAFILTTRKVQEFTSTRKGLNLARQIVGGIIATAGFFFSVIIIVSVSGLGIRFFFIGIIALNVFSIVREVIYVENRRNK
jgi:F0F1-type ATP synthase assembly protein I